MSDAKITLIGFYQFDKIAGNDFFSDLVLPPEIDHDTMVYTILDRGGEYETILGDADYLKAKMRAWSNSWYPTFERWVTALEKEYDPLENYDRIESWSDSMSTSESTSDSTSTYGSESMLGQLSAMDSSQLVNNDGTHRKTVGEGATKTLRNGTQYSTHGGRVHGNIGVTTNDQMLASHMRTRMEWGNIYNHIADLFLHDFVIPIG